MLERPQEGWKPLIERARLELGRATRHLDDFPVEPWCELLDRVVEWNRTHDLTAARSPEELVDLYLADAYVIRSASHGGSWVDVGSGGGAPGLSVALLGPEEPVLLVEPRAKRVAFLRSVSGRLNLGKFVQVKKARSDALAPATADVAISRATFPPGEWLGEGLRLARREIWVLLAQGEVPASPGCRLLATHTYRWPLTGVERRALCFAPESVSSSQETIPGNATRAFGLRD